MTIETEFAWVIGAILVGMYGGARKVGFPIAFFLSLVVSPAIGLVIVSFSPKYPSLEDLAARTGDRLT